MRIQRKRFYKNKYGKPYQPQKKSKLILDRAWDLVNQLEYEVSLRWVFYRLFQEGYYTNKTDYSSKLCPLLSMARKRFYKDWTPFTLADETREPVIRAGGGRRTVEEWFPDNTKKVGQRALGLC